MKMKIKEKSAIRRIERTKEWDTFDASKKWNWKRKKRKKKHHNSNKNNSNNINNKTTT